jgi:hypothetical protein
MDEKSIILILKTTDRLRIYTSFLVYYWTFTGLWERSDLSNLKSIIKKSLEQLAKNCARRRVFRSPFDRTSRKLFSTYFQAVILGTFKEISGKTTYLMSELPMSELPMREGFWLRLH